MTGTMTGTMTAPMTPTARVWDALCRHIDGMAIGTTMAALHERGALAMLAAQDRTQFGPLRERLAANAGFLHVALRLLADQGWVARQGEPGTDQMTITPTARGRIVMTELAGAYPAAVRSLPVRVHSEPGPFGPLMRREWGLPAGVPADARHQVLSHLNGYLIAPVMHALSSGEADIATSRGAAEILAAAGWARLDADVPELTPDGEIAISLARQYRYPVMYLPLLSQVPELIFGEPAETSDGGEETHLDRELDLKFSGDVFTAACREPFLGLALPLFEATPLDRQPALVVDAGCGDGALLETLYLAVRERTVRGRRLAERPLLMAGVDPSPVARRMASARLSAAGVPHVILDGDIGDPAGLERALAARGLDARDALHVCKSAIHDRACKGPAPGRLASPPAYAGPPGAGAYALPDGSAIPASSVALDLARLFRRWLPVASRHGWLVIEAHAAPAAVLARLIGRTHATVLDATHGYACQYPVEPGVFAWAARAGGFVSRGHAEPGAATLGHTILTIDHFAADQTSMSQVL